MRGRKKGTARRVRVFLFVLIVGVFCVLGSFCGGFLVLMYVDKHYEYLRSTLIDWLRKDNHFDGSLWFSAVATFIGALISAVPGLLCGLLAYIQTERLHEVEDRYHRPWLELDEAEVSVIMLRNKKGELQKSCREILDGLPWTAYRYHRTVEAAIDRQSWLYIVLKIDFHVKNEVTVKRVSVREVDFLLEKEKMEWILTGKKENTAESRREIWELNKQIKDGETRYTLEWILCPFEEKATEKFWYNMRDFVLHEGICNSICQHLELNAHLNVEYEYDAGSGTECMLCVEFAADKMQQAPVVQTGRSGNGYFTYDIK